VKLMVALMDPCSTVTKFGSRARHRGKVFIIGNKNLSEVMDKQDKQDISEISDQIQKKIQIVLKKFRRI